MTQTLVDNLVFYATDILIPVMFISFFAGLIIRTLVYFTIKREHWFATELDKRINRFMDDDEGKQTYSFYVLTKRFLEKTFYELFELRGVMKRRRMDYVMSPADRIFLIQSGAAFLVRDTLKQIKFLRYGENHPKFLEISKSVFQNNPCFNRVFGVIPAAPLNDFVNGLPGLMIVGGIFGTFLGIMKALPELGAMDLNDIEGTKAIMDVFLLKISFSMSTSIVGIVLSVFLTLFNTFLSPEKLFVNIVNRYELSLEYLWRRSSNNELPQDIVDFDANKDPLDALAEYALKKELAKGEKPGHRKAEPSPVPDGIPGAIPDKGQKAS